jgi:hypothetical protein
MDPQTNLILSQFNSAYVFTSCAFVVIEAERKSVKDIKISDLPPEVRTNDFPKMKH